MKANFQKLLVCLALAVAGCIMLIPSPVSAQQSDPTTSPSSSKPKVQSASAHSGKTAATTGRRVSLSPHHRKHSHGTRHRGTRGRRKKSASATSQGQ
jgi:hypothetical protein